MNGQASFRGQPLLLLAIILACWATMRVVTWEPLEFTSTGRLALADRGGSEASRTSTPDQAAPPQNSAQLATKQTPQAEPSPEPGPVLRVELKPSQPVSPPRAAEIEPGAPWLDKPLIERPAWEETNATLMGEQGEPTPVRRAIGHNLLLAAGLSNMELPAELAAALDAAYEGRDVGLAQAGDGVSLPSGTGSAAVAALRNPVGESRWSGDAWLFVRDDGPATPMAGQPSYGRSQAGAVIRFKLVPSSPHQPAAFVRGNAALGGAREEDVAAGISGRPIPELPARAAVELRATRNEADTDLRPAAYAVTEFPPLKLPLGMRGEGYLAGGYVGGDFATGFLEGQARVEKLFARKEDVEFTAGAGAWGGAQKDAARLDIGPTAAVSFRLGEARSRLAVDYRVRVAGDAQPTSGPALTLSAGF